VLTYNAIELSRQLTAAIMAGERRVGKWTKESETDLLMALIVDDNMGVKPNWNSVVEKMETWGHTYSKSGITYVRSFSPHPLIYFAT
jgi:hypothetical protein